MARPYRIVFFSKRKARTRYTQAIMRGLARIGCELLWINPGRVRRIAGRAISDSVAMRQVGRFDPDVVLIFSNHCSREILETLRQRWPTALLLDDCFPVDHAVTDWIRRVDVFFLTMTGMADDYRAAGAKKVVYLHSGVDPEWHQPGRPDPKFESEVAFIGAAYYEERNRFLVELGKRVDLKMYGKGWRKLGIREVRREVEPERFAQICASAGIVLGFDRSNEQELYFSNRTWFVLGCAGFLLTRYIPGLETVFANHRHLVWFHDEDDALDQIRWYLAHPEARCRIAAEGYEFAHRLYPFDRMARNIVTVLRDGGDPEPLSDPGPSLERGELEPTQEGLAGSARSS